MREELLSLREKGGPLAALSEQEILDLAAGAEVQHFKAGEILMREGELGNHGCLVLEGLLVAIHGSEGGGDRVVEEIGPGELAGQMELVVGGTRMATVRALEDSRLVVLTRDKFEELLGRSPATWRRVTEIVQRQLRQLQLSKQLHRIFGPFAPTETEIPEALQDATEFVTLASGDDLFHQGDPAEAAYIVLSGLLRVTVDTPGGGEQVINTVRSGETVGEMALLSGEPRSATVYAVRNSMLARIPRQHFDELIDIYPGAMKSLTRIIIERLKRHSRLESRRENLHTSIAFVGANPSVPLSDIVAELQDVIADYGSTVVMSSDRVEQILGRRGIAQAAEHDPSYPRLVEWLHEQQERNRYVLYQADRGWSKWTEHCARQADHVVVVADATGSVEPGETESRLPRCWRRGREPQRSLILLHPAGLDRPRATREWLALREVDAVYHLRRGNPADVGRVARTLAGRALGLVLGGGGARGFAHLGVIRALEELGIPVDMIGGASIGAPVSVPSAQGLSAEQALTKARQRFSALLDYTLPTVALLAGKRITRSIEAETSSWDIEDLWLPFFCISTNLTTARSVVHRRGELARAVRASVAIPGVLPPVPESGDLLVDGGVLNNIPIDVMRQSNPTGPIIAIDVAPPQGPAAKEDYGLAISGWSQVLGRRRRAPGIAAVIMNSLVVGSDRARRAMLDEGLADFYLNIHVRGVGMLDFDKVEEGARIGYEECFGALKEWLGAGGLRRASRGADES